MKKILTDKAPMPIGPYSQAVLADKTLYASGQIALDVVTGELCGDDISSQTEKVCSNIKEVLKAAGMSFDNVVKTTCFLSKMSDFAEFNKVYSQYFTNSPARSCVAAKELPKNALVEIEIIAINV